MNTSPILPYFSNKYSMSSALVRYVRLSTFSDTMFEVSGGGPLEYLDILKIQGVISLWNNANIHLIWWGGTNSSLKSSYNSYTRSWHWFKLNSFKFLVQVKLVQVLLVHERGRCALVHTRSWESRSWKSMQPCLCVVELFIHIKFHSQNIVLSRSIQSNTKFWLNPIIFYSCGCPRKGGSHPPKKETFLSTTIW